MHDASRTESERVQDYLDLERVLRAMTADGRDRLRLAGGRVYLDRLDRGQPP